MSHQSSSTDDFLFNNISMLFRNDASKLSIFFIAFLLYIIYVLCPTTFHANFEKRLSYADGLYQNYW